MNDDLQHFAFSNVFIILPAVTESVFVIEGKTALISEITVSRLQKDEKS